MNDYLQHVSVHSGADVLWSFSSMTSLGRSEFEERGLHIVTDVADRKADVLLNLRCNADATSKGYPFNRTCCSKYKKLNFAQRIILLGGMVVLPVLPFHRRQLVLRMGRFVPSPGALNAMKFLGFTMCYCFYADRTHIFEKVQKQFRIEEFSVACIVGAVAGCVTIRESKSQGGNRKVARELKDQGFLSRDQTDELKGWMQLLLLVYHYTHGSTIFGIYKVARLVVASYLFMTGYGHTLYFLKEEDYSLKRVASVLVRLNLLSCSLPYVMRTDVVFYYFAPLVSLWFLVIYFTLKIRYKHNSNLHFLGGKIILSAILATAFTMIPGLLELISSFLNLTCAISWNTREVRFRIFLDMYVVYIGMLLAALYDRTTCLQIGAVIPKRLIDTILELTLIYNRSFKTLTVLTSFILLPTFWAFSRTFETKEDYNSWQPLISFIPILSFITIRNCHRLLRNYHSIIFAWLGRYSLETYVFQYHIWLAGDTTGILRLGLWGRWTEAAILTPVFFWVSWKMAAASQRLTGWIVDGNRPSPHSVLNGDEVASKESPYLLPTMMDAANTPSKYSIFEIGQCKIQSSVDWLVKRFTKDLRWRLGFILVLLWVGNITYR